MVGVRAGQDKSRSERIAMRRIGMFGVSLCGAIEGGLPIVEIHFGPAGARRATATYIRSYVSFFVC